MRIVILTILSILFSTYSIANSIQNCVELNNKFLNVSGVINAINRVIPAKPGEKWDPNKIPDKDYFFLPSKPLCTVNQKNNKYFPVNVENSTLPSKFPAKVSIEGTLMFSEARKGMLPVIFVNKITIK